MHASDPTQTVKTYWSRWMILAACMVFMTLAGNVYGFGLISDELKSRLNLSQTQLDTVATMGNIGAYMTIIPGLFNNRYGPQKSIWLGIMIAIIGLCGLWVITAQIIHVTSPYVVGTTNLIYMHGSGWLAAVGAPTAAQNFPKQDHGKILGLAKAYLGISSALIAIWKLDLVNSNTDAFLFSLLCFMTIISLTFASFLGKLPRNVRKQYINYNEMGYKNGCCISSMAGNGASSRPENQQYHKLKAQRTGSASFTASVVYDRKIIKSQANFSWWFTLAVSLAIYLISVALIQNYFSFREGLRYTLWSISMLLWMTIWIFPLCLHGQPIIRVNTKQRSLPIESINEEINIDEKDIDIGLPQLFFYIEFWLLYAIFFIVTGCGLMFLNNVSQIVESASETSNNDNNPNDTMAVGLVTCTSIGNFSGRLLAGIVSDRFRNRLPRVFWTLLSTLFMGLSYIYLYFAGTTLYLYYPGAFIVGFSFGLIFTTTIASCADLWGTKYLSGNYCMIDSAPMFSSLCFATFIFGTVYDNQAKNEHDGNKCWGQKCYQLSFLICIGACILGFILSFILWRVVQTKINQKEKVKQELKREKEQNLLD